MGELHFKETKVFLISTYMPCADKKYTDEEFESTLNQVQELINQCPKDAVLIIGGDFNAEIGHGKDDDGVTGQYGPEPSTTKLSDRGQRIRQFFGIDKLITTATFFKKQNYNTHCPMHDQETPTRQIDHV